MSSYVRLWLLFLITIQFSISSCTVQKSITKKDESLNEAILVNSLKSGKAYKFWHKEKPTYEKVKITSVDSVEVKGFVRQNGTSKPFRKTHDEILTSTKRITTKKSAPILSVFAIGVGTIIIIGVANMPVGGNVVL